MPSIQTWQPGNISEEQFEEFKQDGRVYNYTSEQLQCDEHITLLELQLLFSRLDRGQMLYHRHENGELEVFAASRNIAAPVIESRHVSTWSGWPEYRAHRYRRTLIHELEYADDHAIFPRFMELAANLRVRIYNFYISSSRTPYNAFEACVYQPPITLVSPKIRAEALPLWYEGSKLSVQIRVRDFGSWFTTTANASSSRCGGLNVDFFEAAPECVLLQVGKLHTAADLNGDRGS